MKRPEPFSVGKIRVRATRPPTKADPTRWYWRAMLTREETVWAGRGTREEAEHQVLAVAMHIAGGADIRRERGAIAQTVSDVLAYYMGNCADRVESGSLAESTNGGYLNRRKRIRGGLGKILIARLTGRQIANWMRTRERRGDAPLTIGSDVILLKAAVAWCYEAGLIEEVDIRWPATSSERVRPKPTPSRAEVQAIHAELAPWPNEQDAFLFLASTGARQAEMSLLEWQGVDLKASTATITGKTGTRVIPLAGDCLSMMRRRYMAARSKTGLVFGSKARGVTLCQRKLPAACSALGLPRLTPHALRRFVSTELIEANVDRKNYEAIMGHSYEQGLRDYATSRGSTRAKAVESAGLGSLLCDTPCDTHGKKAE